MLLKTRVVRFRVWWVSVRGHRLGRPIPAVHQWRYRIAEKYKNTAVPLFSQCVAECLKSLLHCIFCCMGSFLHFHFLNYFWLMLDSFTLIFSVVELFLSLWLLSLLMLLLLHFVFIPDQASCWGTGSFWFLCWGFYSPHTSPTIGRSLPVGSHLVVIQWGSCSWPFCSNKCAIFIMQRFERLFLFILYSMERKWHPAHVDGCLRKSSVLVRSTKTNRRIFSDTIKGILHHFGQYIHFLSLPEGT